MSTSESSWGWSPLIAFPLEYKSHFPDLFFICSLWLNPRLCKWYVLQILNSVSFYKRVLIFHFIRQLIYLKMKILNSIYFLCGSCILQSVILALLRMLGIYPMHVELESARDVGRFICGSLLSGIFFSLFSCYSHPDLSSLTAQPIRLQVSIQVLPTPITRPAACPWVKSHKKTEKPFKWPLFFSLCYIWNSTGTWNLEY